MDRKSKTFPMKSLIAALIALLGLTGCGGPQIRFLDKKLPPRSEPPVFVSDDPVLHGLEGWERFGAFEIKGTLDDLSRRGNLEKEIMQKAAELGAEGVSYNPATITRGGGLSYTKTYTEKYGSTRIDHYRAERGTPTFSDGFYVDLYLRTKPNAQVAFERLCGTYHKGSRYEKNLCDFKTLKRTLDLSPVDLNLKRRDWTGEKKVTLLDLLVEEITDPRDPQTRGLVADRLNMVSLLLSRGANPNIIFDLGTPTPLKRVNMSLWESTGNRGDSSSKFSNWRQGPPEGELSPGERRAALIELKDMLVKAGATIVALPR